MDSTIELVAVFLNIGFIGTAAYFDVKERLVSDLLWVIMLIPIIGLTLIRIITYPTALLYTMLISCVIAVLISLLLGFVGFWGGADVIAYPLLVLTTPVAVMTPMVAGVSLLAFNVLPFSLTVFFNAIILALLYPIGLFLYNGYQYLRFPWYYAEPLALPKWNKVFACFLGYPIRIPQLLQKNWWSYELLETKRPSGCWKTSIPVLFELPVIHPSWQHHIVFSRFLSRLRSGSYKFTLQVSIEDEYTTLYKRFNFLKEAMNDDRSAIWIQYSLPFLVLLLLGYLFAIVIGNLPIIVLGIFFGY